MDRIPVGVLQEIYSYKTLEISTTFRENQKSTEEIVFIWVPPDQDQCNSNSSFQIQKTISIKKLFHFCEVTERSKRDFVIDD